MSAAGFPADMVEIDAEHGCAALLVDEQLYPRDAIYSAVTPLLSRAYLQLDRVDDRVRVELRPRTPTDAGGLRALLGGLANELLVATTRIEISKRRSGLIEAVTRRAIAGAMGPPDLDDLESFDLRDEGFEDPLGIADSWDRAHANDEEEQS